MTQSPPTRYEAMLNHAFAMLAAAAQVSENQSFALSYFEIGPEHVMRARGFYPSDQYIAVNEKSGQIVGSEEYTNGRHLTSIDGGTRYIPPEGLNEEMLLGGLRVVIMRCQEAIDQWRDQLFDGYANLGRITDLGFISLRHPVGQEPHHIPWPLSTPPLSVPGGPR